MNEIGALDEYEKEKWAAERASEKQIPTPQILKIGLFESRAFSIQTFVEGVEGRRFSGDKTFIWKRFGEYAKRLHGVRVGGFGLSFSDMTAGGSEALWRRYLFYNIESLNERDELLKLCVLTPVQSKTARGIFENLETRDFKFGLNHGDFSLKNAIVNDAGKVHPIDWGSSEASIVPHHELIQLLRVQMQENEPGETELAAFLEGYGIDAAEYAKMLPDLQALSLLRAFDKLRWALDRKVSNLNDYVSIAKTTANLYL